MTSDWLMMVLTVESMSSLLFLLPTVNANSVLAQRQKCLNHSPSRLDRQANFTEVPPRLLITERLGDFLQRKGAIDERAYTSGLDSAHHLLLMGTAADDQPLQTRLLSHQLGGGYLTTAAGENTNQ